MKKLLLCSFILLTNVAHSENETLSPYPGAKDGINIWPMSKIYPKSNSKLLLPENKGYIETTETNQSVSFLLDIKKTAKQVIKQYENVNDDSDTNLKSSINKLHLSFKFNGIPTINESDVIGYAVAGGYKTSWDGAIEFADIKEAGTCSLSTYKIESVIMAKERMTYEINGKATDKLIQGNYSGGFLYSVNWYTNSRMYSFECANVKFDQTIMDKMILLSKKIEVENK